MKSSSPGLQRLIGATGMSALLGLIIYAGMARESMPGDSFYWMVRWPLWLLAFVAAPVIAARLVLWKRERSKTVEDSPSSE